MLHGQIKILLIKQGYIFENAHHTCNTVLFFLVWIYVYLPYRPSPSDDDMSHYTVFLSHLVCFCQNTPGELCMLKNTEKNNKYFILL